MPLVLRSEKNGVLFPYDHNLAQLGHVTTLDYDTMRPVKDQPNAGAPLSAEFKVEAVRSLDLTPQAAPVVAPVAAPQKRRRNTAPLTVDVDA